MSEPEFFHHVRYLASMVVDDFHAPGVAIGPSETDSPLSVDPDAVLPSPVALQRFQLIRRRDRQVLEISSGMQLLQLHQGSLLDILRQLARILAVPDPLRFPVA